MRFLKKIKVSDPVGEQQDCVVCYDNERRILAITTATGTNFFWDVPFESYIGVRQGVAFMPSMMRIKGHYAQRSGTIEDGEEFAGCEFVDKHGERMFHMWRGVGEDHGQAGLSQLPAADASPAPEPETPKPRVRKRGTAA